MTFGSLEVRNSPASERERDRVGEDSSAMHSSEHPCRNLMPAARNRELGQGQGSQHSHSFSLRGSANRACIRLQENFFLLLLNSSACTYLALAQQILHNFFVGTVFGPGILGPIRRNSISLAQRWQIFSPSSSPYYSITPK